MRSKYLIALFIITVSLCPTFAQHDGYRAIKDVSLFRTKFAAESAKLITIRSDFRQDKELLALTEKLTSTGKFWFKRSDLVRIDYEKPFIYRMIMNGDRILIKDESKENKVNLKSNKLFQQVNRIMVDCIQGTILESKNFSTKVFENDEKYLLELTPIGKGLKDFFTTINLVVDKKNYSVDIIEMKETGGDRTVLTFTGKVLNEPIKNEVFAF